MLCLEMSLFSPWRKLKEAAPETTPETTCEAIRTTICDSVKRVYATNNEGYEFVPCNLVDGLVTEDLVHSSWPAMRATNHQLLHDYILGNPGARRLFVILARMRKLHLLDELRRHGLNDSALPLGFRKVDGNVEGYSYNEEASTYQFFANWDENDHVLFRNWQWELVAPKFGGAVFQFNFCKDYRLPYLHCDASPASDGFFGEVSRASIHREHLDERTWPKVSGCLPSTFGFIGSR